MMSAYSVMDSVNKYRHGVLLGNYVEDKFGSDLASQGPIPDTIKLPTTKDHHDPSHSLYKSHELIKDKQGRREPFHVVAKHIEESNYKRPENETSYNIFHQQEVAQQVPILTNNPKKQANMNKDGNLYANTRYYLSNKFSNPKTDSLSTESDHKFDINGLRETGNVYNLDQQQIPDILTGQIFKTSLKQPDADAKATTKHTGQPMTRIEVAGKPKAVNPHGTNSLIKPDVEKYDESEYKKQVYHNERGQHHSILFGHGLQINEFHRKQLGTTYDLSFNQKIKPQTQVDSFYNVDAMQSTKKFHREILYEKNYQDKIPEVGKKQVLGQEKWGRPYDPYTKTFDKNHLKNEYLRS